MKPNANFCNNKGEILRNKQQKLIPEVQIKVASMFIKKLKCL